MSGALGISRISCGRSFSITTSAACFYGKERRKISKRCPAKLSMDSTIPKGNSRGLTKMVSQITSSLMASNDLQPSIMPLLLPMSPCPTGRAGPCILSMLINSWTDNMTKPFNTIGFQSASAKLLITEKFSIKNMFSHFPLSEQGAGSFSAGSKGYDRLLEK